MKKLLVLMMALVMTLSLAACGGDDTATTEATTASATANVTDATDWPYKDVTPEQIQALTNILTQMSPLYNEAAAAAQENGWDADETVLEELNVIYTLIDAGTHGVADPSEYEGATDMAAVVEQYQAILDSMPDLIAKVSQPYAG